MPLSKSSYQVASSGRLTLMHVVGPRLPDDVLTLRGGHLDDVRQNLDRLARRDAVLIEERADAALVTLGELINQRADLGHVMNARPLR